MFRQSAQRLVVRYQSSVAKTAPKPLSVAYVGKLETRWEGLPKEDQTQLIDELKARMELPWQELTPSEKRSAYYISFGEWGPRKPLYGPGDRAKVVYGVLGGIGLAVLLFAGLRSLAAPDPTTLNKQWQEKSDEYLKSKNANPFTGYSQVQ
ncbi:uncharacterized protein PRCAT00003319001 [Priceomyces carsonii]|uniref:uncharacterized protein n=1 Tax=Priceomyces carsonii TaxID=28549 RepID=UPI002ED88754|nr:unnamed protein product [Priceomyces carsonii]